MAAWISVVIVATLVPFTPAPPAGAVEAPVTCWQTWVGPVTGSTSWTDPDNWSPAGVPISDSTVCFGAAFGGTAVDGVRIEVASVMVDQLHTDDDAEITLVAGELTVLAVADIDGVRLDGARYVYNNPAVLAAGGTAGGDGTFAGPLTIEAGATMSGDEITFEGSVANEGTIVGPTPQTAEDGSVIVFAGSYGGAGRLDAPVLQLRSGADVQPDASARVTISTASVDSDAQLFLPSGQVGLIDAHGRVSLGAGVQLRQLHLTEPAVVELLDGATIEPDAVSSSGNVMITGNGTLRPGTLDVAVLEQQTAFRRGDATALPVVAGPIGRAAIPVVIVRRSSADTAERWGDPDAVGLRRADGPTTTADPAVPSLATTAGSTTLLRDGMPAQGFTLFGNVTVEARTSTHIGARAEFSQGPNTNLSLSGETTFVTDAAQVAPFGRLANDSNVAIDGCFLVQADGEYLTGTGPALAFMDGGTFDVTATIASATRPIDGARWEVEFRTHVFEQFRGAGVRAAAGDPEFGEYRLQSVLGDANPTSCPAPAPLVVMPTQLFITVVEGDVVRIPLSYLGDPAAPAVFGVEARTVAPHDGDETDFEPFAPFVFERVPEIVLTTVDDELPEGTDVVQVVIADIPVEVTILEDDIAAPGLSVNRRLGDSGPVAEGDSVAVTLDLPQVAPGGMQVTWRASFDPALLDPDAVPADAFDIGVLDEIPVRIDRLALSVPFELDVLADGETEPAEQFAIVADVDGLASVFDPVFVVTIANEIEPLTVTLSPLPADVREGDGEITFELVVTGGAEGTDLFFPVTATTNGDEPDWASGAGVSVTGPGTYPVRLFVFDDEVIEQPEPYVVRIGDPIPAADVTYVVRERTGILVDDDAAPEVGVTISDPAVMEADAPPGSSGVDGTIEVVFRATGDLGSTPIQVPFTVEGVGELAATAGSDVTPATGTVVIDPSDPQDPEDPGAVTIVLAAPDDALYEGTETYRIVLGEPQGATLDPAASSAEGTILDDEPLPVVSIAVDDAVAAEAVASNTITMAVEVTGRPERIVAVPVVVSGFGDVAITPATDVDRATFTLGVSDANQRQTFTITAVDDGVYEGDESLQVAFGTLVGATSSPLAATAIALVIDDEQPPVVVEFADADAEVSEGGATQMHVALDPAGAPIERPLTVTVQVAGDEPAADLGVDVDLGFDVLPDGTIEVSPTLSTATPEATFVVTTIDDDEREDDEQLRARVTGVAIAGQTQRVPATISAALTILDDDGPVSAGVVFVDGADEIGETTEGAAAGLRVLADTAVGDEVVVAVEVVGVAEDPLAAADPATDVRVDGAAVAGPPFVVTVAMPAAPAESVVVPFELFDDALVEGDELLEVRIVAITVDGVTRAIDDLSGPARLTVVDDDGVTPVDVAVAFGTGDGSADEAEGATVPLRVLADPSVDGEVAVTVELIGLDDRGLAAADVATDVLVDGTAISGPPFRHTIVVPTSPAGSIEVPVTLVEDSAVESDELVEVRIVGVTVDGVPRTFDDLGGAAQVTIRDDDGPVAVSLAIETSPAAEGATVQLHTTAGVNGLDGPVAVTVEFAGPTSDLLAAGDPETDITVDGAALPGTHRFTFLVPKSPTQDVRVPILIVDDTIAEQIETLEVRVVTVTVDGAPRAFTPTDQVVELVITDDDDPVDEAEEAEQVDAFRRGMFDLPDLLGSWAELFDFTPGAWDGGDPVDLPVGNDRLATLAEVGPAVAAATGDAPVPAATDDTWDEVVRSLTDPDDDGTPNESDEGACNVVHVVRGIGGFTDAPDDGLIEVRCDLTLGELIEQVNGGALDQWNDETEALQGIAELLALDADDGLQFDTTIQLVFGLDTQGFYVKATSGIDAHLHGEIHLAGTGTVFGIPDVDIEGDGRIDVHLRLGPEGSGKLREAQLVQPASEIVRPEVQGTASADLTFTRDDDTFEWHAAWTLQTPAGADPLVELDEQRLRMELHVPGLETGVVDRPDSVIVEGTFANGFWTLEGSLDDAAISGFVIDHAEFTALVDTTGVVSAEADVDLVLNEAGEETFDVAVHWERDRDGWRLTGTLPIGDRFVRRALFVTGAEVVVSLAHDGANGSGSVQLTADTAVLFPEVGDVDPDIVEGGAFVPNGLLTATGVSGAIVPGGVSLHADTIAASIARGAVSFDAADVDLRLGSTFADQPVLAIDEIEATFSRMPTTLVTITGLQVLQDGRVGAASAEVDRADGFFDGKGLDDVLPFSVTNVRLDFTDTVAGTDPPLRSLDAFDVTVTGSFDQDEMADWPFTPQIQVGGEIVTPTSDPDANSFTFAVSIDSLADGVVRPLDLGPIGFGFEGVEVGRSALDGFLSLDGWQDGVLQPGFTGEVVLARGVDTPDENSKRATLDGTLSPGRVDIDAEFAITGRYGNLDVRDLALAFSMQFGLDDAGETYATVDLQTLSVAEMSLTLGPWAKVSLGDATLDLGAGPDEPALVVAGDPSDPTSGLGVSFLADFPELEGWGGRIGGITVCGDGSIHATEQTFVTLTVPEDTDIGLPPELPVFVDEAGLIFDVDIDPADPCGGGTLNDVDDVIVRFSGGVRATEQWPLSFELDGIEVSLGRLIGQQPGFPIVNLDEITLGMEPQELGAGVTLGGEITLGHVPVDGQDVFYLQVQGSVGVSGIEFGGNVVITQYGPVIMALQAPVGIPIGPTGLVLSSVAAGVQFGVELPSIDEPLDLLSLPISPVDADVDRDAIIDAIRPVLGGGALWDRPFSIAGTGFITSIASPGMAGGEVTFGMNIGFRPGDGAKLFARGDLTAFGIPVGGGGIFIDLSSPVEPIIDVAFALPGPQAGPISFVMPSEGQFTMRIDTTGVAPAAAIAVRTFLSEVLNGSVEIGGAAFAQAIDAMAAELDEARHRPLARFLLDVNGDGVVSDAEDAVPLTSAMVFTRLLAMLPSSPSAAAALLASNPDLVTAVIGELLIALDGVSVGGEVPADLLAAFGEGQRTMAAFVAMVSTALRDAGTAALAVFDPSVTISGSIQPIILGIPFGEPEAAGSLTINRDGITVGYSISVTKLVQRLGEMIIPFVGGEIVTLLTVGGVDRWDLTAQLPFGGFVESLVTGTVAPRIDPNDGRWAISGQGRIGLLGYELTGADLIITAPQNQRFVDQRVQQLFDPVTGQPMDISPVQIDTNKIPIVTKADYDNLLKYGGILISGRMQVPGMIVDPLTLVQQIGPAPAKIEDTLGWLRQVAETVTAPATPVRGTLFLPSPQILLTQQLDAIGDDRFSVNTAAANFVSDAGAWLRAASFNGVYEGMFMSIPAFKATVRGTATGLSINGTVPLIGVRSTFQVAMRDQEFPGGVTLPIPTVELRTNIDPTSEGSLLNRLGVPADFEFISGSLELQILSPGFDPRSRDAFERQGGTRVTARANVDGIVEDAEIVVGVLVPSNPVAGADFDLEVRADQLGIVGFGITEPELVFRKRGFDIIGELHGRATVLGAAASVDGEFSVATGGSLTITFDSGSGPTLSGFNLSASASLEIRPKKDEVGFDVTVSFTGQAGLPAWLSNAAGRATATVSGCLDPSGDAEFVVSLAEFGFGAMLPSGKRRVTIGARTGQSAGQPAAACSLPPGATASPGGAVIRLRRDDGVASVFVDGQMTFNDPLMFMPSVGVTGSFSSTGVGSLAVDGSVNLLGSTLKIGATVTVTQANGATGTLTLSTPPGQPLTLAGWAVGGTLSLTLSATAATVSITNGTLTIPGAGTHTVNGSISVKGEGSFNVVLPANGLRLGPSPSPFFATGSYTISFLAGVGTFKAVNAGLQVRNGSTTLWNLTVPLFEVGSDGTLNVTTNGFSFTAPGGFSIVVPPIALKSNAAMGAVRLDVGAGSMTVPGLADGSPGHPKLATPAFTIDTTLDFTKTLVAADLSLGIAELQGKLVLVGSDGVFSIRIDPLSVTQPAHVRFGNFDMDIETFTIASNGTFDVEFLVRQFGPDALSIRDLTLAMSKTGASLTTFSASLTGGKLFLPMGEPIALPELEFDFDSRIDHTFTIDSMKLGPFFSMTSASFRLRQLSSGLIRFEATNSPSVSLLGDTVGLTLDDLLVESDGTFSGQVSGQLSLFGRALGSATFQIANVGGVVRLRIPAGDPVSYNLLFANANFHGDVFSDGRFSLTGSLSIDIDILIASLSGSVSITVANTGISGEFDGTACVFPFPCVSASGTMSSTGFVESTVKVDTNGNGIKDTFYDVDFQIGAGPSGGADTTKPSMAAPGNKTINADIPTGRSKARVYYATPTATDQGATVPVVCTPPSGSDFSVGATTVTCRASDRAGNTRTVTFTVTVNDTSPNVSAIAQAAAGGAITQSGSGFAGNAAVMATMFSDPVVLGTAVADLDGNVTFELTIPADAPPGEHTIVLSGEGPDGGEVIVSRTIEVIAAGAGPGSPSGEPGATTPGTTTPGSGTPSGGTSPGGTSSGGTPSGGTPSGGTPSSGTPSSGTPSGGTAPTVPGTSGASPSAEPTTTLPGSGTSLPKPVAVHFVDLPPTRVLDTRDDAAVAGGTVRQVPLAGRAGVPADATAVVVNVTITEPRAAGYATVHACGSALPATSTVNFVAGETVAAMATAGLGGGAVCVFVSATTHVVVDVNGAYSPSVGTGVLTPVAPVRVFDSRSGGATALSAGTHVVSLDGVAAVPSTSTAVVVNVAVDAPEGPGFVTVFPCGIERPLASNLNTTTGRTASNAATVAIGAAGSARSVCVYTSMPTHVVVDVMGVYLPGPATVLRPAADRVLDTREAGSGGRLGAGEVRVVDVGEPGAVVVLNLTADDPATAGYVTVFPCDRARPLASNLNLTAGRPRANAVVARAGSTGEVCVYTSTALDLIVDVTAVFPAA